MNRRGFLAATLANCSALSLPAPGSGIASTEEVEDVLVMFKCHLDVGFVDTQAAIIRRYFTEHYPRAIQTASTLRKAGNDHYIWTTGSWLLYEYLEQATSAERKTMEAAVVRGDIAWHALPFTWQSELLDGSMVEGAIGFSKSLDKHFGTKTTGAKMTDVPGHTRGLVSPLEHAGVTFLNVGVNSASTPPDVPELFVWRDTIGGSLIVMYHRRDYGGVVHVPGSRLAIAVEVRDDNSGPHTLDEIRDIYRKLRSQFPKAHVRASNLTEIANTVSKYKSNLPEFKQEIGDTWIHGVASDPTKLSRYRELLRLRSEWVRNRKIAPGDAADLRFLSKFSLAVEHTWGTDTKTWLDFDHYAPQALASMLETPKYGTVTQSWVEKRQDIDDAVQNLPEVLRSQAMSRLGGLKPTKPAIEGMSSVAKGTGIETSRFRLRIDPATGSIVSLQNKLSGKHFADDQHPLALFTYQALSQEDYARFLKSYITVDKDWAPKDFGKPNIGHFGAESKQWHAAQSQVWQSKTEDGDRIVVQLSLGPQADEAVTAWPEETFLQIDAPANESALHLRLTWFAKRANRMPEALWLTFQPSFDDPKKWTMSKLEQPVSPFDIVSGGNRHLHALTGPLTYRDDKQRVAIESFDAAVVSLGEQSPIYFSNEQPDLSRGFHYSLFNNGWGTNYVQWFGEDAQFRFKLELT